MDWKENPQLSDRLLDIIAEDMKLNKPLPHVTELIYCLTRSYHDRFDYIPLSPKEVVLFSIGVELGKGLVRSHRQEVDGVLDGIHYSIDFMDPEKGANSPPPSMMGRLGEIKSTRMPVKKLPVDFPVTWTKQLLSYMKCQGSTQAIYSVVYLQPAVFKTWEVEATQQEVDGNWDWLLSRYKLYMDFIGRGEVPTPFEYNESWECKNCRYKLLCDASLATEQQEL